LRVLRLDLPALANGEQRGFSVSHEDDPTMLQELSRLNG
jgi:hypothetical protein